MKTGLGLDLLIQARRGLATARPSAKAQRLRRGASRGGQVARMDPFALTNESSAMLHSAVSTAALMLVIAATSACNWGGGRGDTAVAAPQDVQMRVENLLPPGQSGHFSAEGQAMGSVTGNPADFGPHIDDQRLQYWSSQFKPGGFQNIQGREPDLEPKPGVSIYLDEYGVPAVYADTVTDLWFGAGYIMAVQRLFLMDGVRRQARGTLAELTGPGTVPQDAQTRILTYTDAEYSAMFASLSDTAQQATQGYVAGANQRIDEVLLDPSALPLEYVVLSSQPQHLTVNDVLASGVLMTRFVAAEGGNEMENVIALKALQEQHGASRGRDLFQDLFWVDDKKAAVTIPAAAASFANITTPLADREAVFQAQADFAQTLPDELLTGPGTGHLAEPAGLPLAKRLPDPAAQAARYFREFLGNLHGGSYMVIVGGAKSANGLPLLFNGPQLGYSYPSLLAEIEVHGAGFHARGATVPGLPVVGIGYGERIAWGLTTGYSKTIDSFIADTSVGEGPNQYLYQGEVRDMECRTETVAYREAPQGVPTGPASFAEPVEVCRTVHGPVVARSEDGRWARAVQYAMWQREVETIEGVIDWQRASNLAEFHAAMEKVTWNENTMYVDADGNTAFYHPGLHPRRSPATDLRLPNRGTGEQDHQGMLRFDQTPQLVNPAQGYLANWNNKPATGWGDGVGGNAITRPAAPIQRVKNWQRLLAARDQISFTDLIEMDRQAGRQDVRAHAWLPLISAALTSGRLAAPEAALAEWLVNWDELHYNPAIDIQDEAALDRPAETIFHAFVEVMREQMFAALLPAELFARLSAVGNHEYDASPLDNLVLKVLDPELSSIPLRLDYSQGRDVPAWVQLGLAETRQRLEAQYGSSDPAQFRRIHHRDEVCSLTGGIVGPCITMPHQDRGSWNEIIGFERR